MAARWLLIGNSRWHWAEATPQGLRGWSEPPAGPAALAAPLAWAAVGAVPADGASVAALPPARRLALAEVPLRDAPPWLGIDRALAGWQAQRQSGAAVLVADAGTALSLTRVAADGRFAGGRLLAGAGLQLRALAEGTAALPGLDPPLEIPANVWPADTAEAMRAGVLRGLAAAVAQAWEEARQDDRGCGLWLTGGDGPALAPLLGLESDPLLALRALACLRPG